MKINKINIGNELPFVLIAGPCAIENLDSALFHAEKIKNICFDLNIPLIYKSSFDKANRTSISSERGIGIDDGLEILSKVKTEFNLTIITDIHDASQCQKVSPVVDILHRMMLYRTTYHLGKIIITGFSLHAVISISFCIFWCFMRMW